MTTTREYSNPCVRGRYWVGVGFVLESLTGVLESLTGVLESLENLKIFLRGLGKRSEPLTI